ncbi:hypothetical protein TTY48_01520 [Tsukamurella sp. TY48]|uniref:VOC family protein n=1 Tax=Tsukamurella sp. TY48 TaxID=2775495 RepID=UPI001C7CE217|nr:VOC family protein [Tsukamurella sp. TY48]GIZ95540.1 hypothetical protein TTY48_01520 [Tsukamurella sp. TY48]
MCTTESRDLLILDVPVESRAAHARLLASTEADAVTVGGLDVVLSADGTPSGVLVAADVLDGAVRLADRRGLPVRPDGDRAAAVVDGLTLGLVGPTRPYPAVPGAEITGMDHLVLSSPNRDRIIATLCGRLDFDLRLDRVQSWGVHQLFFRRGDLLVEVVLAEGDDVDPSGPDALWGVAWRTADADATHRRLTDQGITVSEVRRGAKPGTRVATIKDPALGVPTIVLEQR